MLEDLVGQFSDNVIRRHVRVPSPRMFCVCVLIHCMFHEAAPLLQQMLRRSRLRVLSAITSQPLFSLSLSLSLSLFLSLPLSLSPNLSLSPFLSVSSHLAMFVRVCCRVDEGALTCVPACVVCADETFFDPTLPQFPPTPSLLSF
eukprot:723145-Pleurochrysis_carterae.AAC.2